MLLRKFFKDMNEEDATEFSTDLENEDVHALVPYLVGNVPPLRVAGRSRDLEVSMVHERVSQDIRAQ